MLLLEDLAGWRMGDQVTGTSIADARVLVASLARMQAKFWDVQPGAMGVEWVPVHNNPAQIAGMQAGFNNGWPVVCARMPELIPANAMRVAERIAPAVPLLLARMCVAPLTLTHSDVRLDNVFFGADEIALVDWQSVCLSAPEHDLAYFITQSLSHESRRAHGLELVRLYVDELQRNGVSGYTFDECFQRYRYAALYLACFAVTIAGTLDMGNERGDQLARALLGRSLQAIDELDGYALLG